MKSLIISLAVIASASLSSMAFAQEGGGYYPTEPVQRPDPVPAHPTYGCPGWVGQTLYYWSYSRQFGWTCQAYTPAQGGNDGQD